MASPDTSLPKGLQRCHHCAVNPHRRPVALALAALAIVSTLVGLAAPAHANGNCVTYFAGRGTGTATDPYLVASQLDLEEVSFCRTSSFRQTRDITLTGNWTPLGTNVSPFTGMYDGADLTISGLVVNLPTTDNVGLFGYASGATLTRIRLSNASVTGRDYVGSLAGVALNTTISYSSAAASIAGVTTVGGLVGVATGSTISQSFSSSNIRATGNYVGGLAGSVSTSSSVSDSFASGPVSGDWQVGGLIGENAHSSVTNSYATGLVTAGAPGNSQGGLVGQQDTGSYPGSVWNIDTTGQTEATMSGVSHTSPPTGLTTAEMTSLATFTSLGWSIRSTYSSSSTWLLCPSVNGGYPFLTHFVDSANPPCAEARTDLTIWHLSIARASAEEECPANYQPSWAQWPNGSTGGWVCNREIYAYRPLPIS